MVERRSWGKGSCSAGRSDWLPCTAAAGDSEAGGGGLKGVCFNGDIVGAEKQQFGVLNGGMGRVAGVALVVCVGLMCATAQVQTHCVVFIVFRLALTPARAGLGDCHIVVSMQHNWRSNLRVRLRQHSPPCGTATLPCIAFALLV